MLGRLLEPALFAECGAQIVVRLDVVGTEREHPAIARLGVGMALCFTQEIAELIMGFEEIRIADNGLAECGFGVPVAAERAQHETEAVADIGLLRRECRRAFDVRERSFGVAAAQGDDAEKVPGAGVRLVAREQRTAGRLRLLKPALRLFGEGAREQLVGPRSARPRERWVFGRFQCGSEVRRG